MHLFVYKRYKYHIVKQIFDTVNYSFPPILQDDNLVTSLTRCRRLYRLQK